MKSCAEESPSMTTRRSSLGRASSGPHLPARQSRFSPTRPTAATSRRRRSFDSTKRPHRFDGRSRFSTWFYRILVNLCIDHQRRNRWWRRVAPLSGSLDDADGRTSRPAFGRAGTRVGGDPQANRAPAQQGARTVIAQSAGGRPAASARRFSSREIAAVLKCSETTARVHLHRGITQVDQDSEGKLSSRKIHAGRSTNVRHPSRN